MPPNPPAPPAEKKPPEAPPAKKVALPRAPKELKGSDAERVKVWAKQSKDGTITLCNEKGCYYPLLAKRDSANHNEPVYKKDENGKTYVEAVCSYDPTHCDGSQRIYGKTKEDELDPNKV